jgi:hypothetical protein
MSQVRLAILLALASAAAGAAPAPAADSTATGAASAASSASMQSATGTSEPASDRPRKYVTANTAGLVVVLDRQTGDMRALTAEEAQYLAQGMKELLNQSTDGLVQVQRADGSVSMDLQGRFQNVMLARKEDDGTISQACVDNVADAAAFFEIDPELINAAQRTVSQAPTALDIR